MFKRSAQVAVAAAATVIGATLVSANPAFASSGGGCSSDANLGACISYQASGGFRDVRPDFYLNIAPDSSYCYAQMETVTTNVGTSWSQRYRLDHRGHYGPVSVNVNTMPGSTGSAVNKVHVYTCSGAQHAVFTSPRVYYP